MAKPFIVASTDGASSSSSPLYHRRPPLDPPCRPRRRRRAVATAALSLAPSTTLLSLLSTLASSSVAEGSPAPPAFLCPSIQPPPTSTRRKHRRDLTSTTPTPTVTASPRTIVRNISDKYQPGVDGIWRRVDSYTFYGICAGCLPTGVSAIDDSGSNDSITMTDLSATLNNTTPPDKLPPGWAPKPTTGHESRTTLILAMSLVLAFFICFLIIGCLFWRKNMRRRYEERDLEMKGKARRRSEDMTTEQAREAARESRSKQKLWSRATARWRENARHSARQRRLGKRTSIRVKTHRSSLSLDNPRDGLTTGRSSPALSVTPPHSRALSRRPSSISLQHEDPTTLEQDLPTISLSPTPSLTRSSPPAYQQKALQGDLTSDSHYHAGELTSSSHLICSRRPSHSSFLTRSENELGEIPIAAAHVATDDKAVLARLANLASAPPSEENTDLPAHPEVSAPEWLDEDEDEEMEELIAQSEGEPNQAFAGSSLFPPPPSKGSLPAPNFYDYPYAFEDMELPGMELELGLSAPPFEQTSSAPLAVEECDLSLQPSAPPLMDEDDFYVNAAVPSTSDLEHDEDASNGVTRDDTVLRRGPTLPDYHP